MKYYPLWEQLEPLKIGDTVVVGEKLVWILDGEVHEVAETFKYGTQFMDTNDIVNNNNRRWVVCRFFARLPDGAETVEVDE